jgi:acyl-lipid omega-6 desaturase (Delta-12 desaturase)
LSCETRVRSQPAKHPQAGDEPQKRMASRRREASLGSQLSAYEKPHNGRAVRQLLNTLVPYGALWALMVWMVNSGVSYWLLLPLIALGSGLLLRIFVLFHDCCHCSFFTTRWANRTVGYVMGVLAFTPYDYWRHCHNMHHATAGDLDRRGIGDVWTMTVSEYETAPTWRRVYYRLFRHPIFLFGLGPPVMFLVSHRIPPRKASRRERVGVLLNDAGLLAIVLAASATIGLPTYLLIQLPMMAIASCFGVWLFFIQHQVEDIYWARHEEWDPLQAAFVGSTYYKLPRVMEWFSASIGLHHIHHLRPRIPNYNLRRCFEELPAMQQVETLTFIPSLKSIALSLWDEENGKLISFGALKSRC